MHSDAATTRCRVEVREPFGAAKAVHDALDEGEIHAADQRRELPRQQVERAVVEADLVVVLERLEAVRGKDRHELRREVGRR